MNPNHSDTSLPSFNPQTQPWWGVQWHSVNRRPVCFSPSNLGGGVWTQHTHLPEFLIHCSEAERCPRAARLLGQHAESGLQQQISLRTPDASEPGWCCGVKIKQTPVPKPMEARVKLSVWFTLLLTALHIPVMTQLRHWHTVNLSRG